ncbi:cytochrome C family protein [Geobacter metallireducens RCH3]|uniref:Cytochrome c n=1 Tax=Geobacter metallireducens (strain ATCC 53774 / DSM 7210 / GS-15) TaxID=269799 RepID=Q39RK8_GEOMG|nr:cytochrome c3 family protein [Geobacter metallireducens]ABB33116.1 cytochrome c [Geobacter metallireducens GS-15]EHP87115.1 cytochrome C family protein [Geobacter metallireducens RCH3]
MSRRGITGVVTAVFLGWAAVAFGGVSFIYPAPNAWVENSNHLILKLNSTEVTGVRIGVNGVVSDLLVVGSPEYRRAFQDFLIVQPVWDRGRNEVTVETFIGKSRAETAQASVYFAPGAKASDIPPEFKANSFHQPDLEARCVGCHDMAPSSDKSLSTLAKENPCIGCHRKMLDVKFVHGPAGTYSCGYCHKEKATPKYVVTKREAPLCNECHGDKAAEFAKRKYIHGPIAGGMCEVCHDSHGSANYGQLKAPINELCLSCHESIKKTPHVVRTTTGAGHPVSGAKDPSAPKTGREMSCISCHNPHAGDARYFFVNNSEDRLLLCQMCHNK